MNVLEGLEHCENEKKTSKRVKAEKTLDTTNFSDPPENLPSPKIGTRKKKLVPADDIQPTDIPFIEGAFPVLRGNPGLDSKKVVKKTAKKDSKVDEPVVVFVSNKAKISKGDVKKGELSTDETHVKLAVEFEQFKRFEALKGLKE